MLTRILKRLVCLLTAALPCLVGQQPPAPQFTTIDYPGAVGTYAVAISKDGVVLGRWTDASGNAHGLLWIYGAMYAFDCQGAVSTVPRAMNSRKEAVGTYRNAAGKWTGFYLAMGVASSWEEAGAKCVSIEPKGAVGRNSSSAAFGISESGEIAGWFDDAQNAWHGYLLRDGVYLTYDMVEGADSSPRGMSPLAMSPQGELVGHMQVTGDRMRGWFRAANKLHILDFPPGESNAMTCGFAGNSKGEIVGHYQRTGEMVRGLYYKDGVYGSFVVPDSRRTDGQGINEDGVIVGYYIDQNGKTKGFILRR